MSTMCNMLCGRLNKNKDMKRQRQRGKLTVDERTRRTFHYNTRSSSRRVVSNTDTADEPASLTVTKRRKKKISADLPTDLIIEILKRLPAKTLTRFLCVSKFWESIIRSRDFKNLYLMESSSRPGRLFFIFRCDNNDRFLFSSNQTPNPGAATYHITPPVSDHTMSSSSWVHDLICYGTASGTELVVYNSTTKRSITLPKFKYKTIFRHFLCYDPIDAVYKVLCRMTGRLVFNVLTLGKGNEWRKVINCHYQESEYPINSQICINGVLYYDAYSDVESKEVVIMTFDVRSEKLDLIKGPGADYSVGLSTLIRYEGKVTILSNDISADGGMALWVLEDPVKHQWLKKVFVLPNYWMSLAQGPHQLNVLYNITVSGEFIVAPPLHCVPPFYVLYYDPKRNSVRKVSIEGIIGHELLPWNIETPWCLYHLFSSEVESLMLW